MPLTIVQRRIYILPTAAGGLFAVLLFVMLLAGLNYANGLALFLTFTLGGLALVAMHLCHRNLLGTELTGVHTGSAFVGEQALLELTFGNPGRTTRWALRAVVDHEAEREAGTLDELPPAGASALRLRLPATRRGRLNVDRIRLESSFPFGLFRAWTWLHLPLEIIVYPAARGDRLPLDRAATQSGARTVHAVGGDEWSSLRAFREGDSPRQVAWTAYARGAPLLVKEYSNASAAEQSFDYARLESLPPEARLEQLCRWVVDAAERGERFELLLPRHRIARGAGLEHRERSLRALALFEAP